MNKRKCIILKENCYHLNDISVKEIEKKIRYLIKSRNVNKFYIEEKDYLSKIAIRSVNNKALIKKLDKEEELYYLKDKLIKYKSIIKDCDYIVFVGFEFFDSNTIKFYMNINYDNIKYIFVDVGNCEIPSILRFE